VRFFVSFAGEREIADPAEGRNGFAGWPRAKGLSAFYELEAVCRGPLDPVAQYVVDIKSIDRALRSSAVPALTKAAHDRPGADPAALMPVLFEAAREACPVEIVRLAWRLSPHLVISMNATTPQTSVVSLSFDFAASHRLYVPSLSEEENFERFGKCARPNGHGHNYRLDVRVETPASTGLDLAVVERVTEEAVLDHFDHRHLNNDTEAFGPKGVIPTVENIARVSFQMLAPAISKACGEGVSLRDVTVWETDRTAATYPADRNAG